MIPSRKSLASEPESAFYNSLFGVKRQVGRCAHCLECSGEHRKGVGIVEWVRRK
jgi:hypothetical protein